jgi:hypothetical protein
VNTEAQNRPTPMIDVDTCQPECRLVDVQNVDADVIAALRRSGQPNHLLESVLRVRVVGAEPTGSEKLPDVFGRRQISENGVRFFSHFPFEPGVVYRATFDTRPLGRTEVSELLTLEFSLPKAPSALLTEVERIFPSSDCLPENLLRFYVVFSNSMQRGRAEAEIVLLGPDGEPAPDTLYRAPVELWDRSMRCLTILLDPGRLKRGVGPNRELGPPLRAGQVYTLVVGAGMLDSSGCRLGKTFYKHFRVTEAVREHIAVEQWKIVPPVTKSRQPLVLMFPRALDWALIAHTITIASSDGQLIDGRVVIDQCERRLSFTPTSSWAAGSYHVRVASSLEDVCGNSVVAAFEKPLRSASDLPYEAPVLSIGFHLP